MTSIPGGPRFVRTIDFLPAGGRRVEICRRMCLGREETTQLLRGRQEAFHLAATAVGGRPAASLEEVLEALRKAAAGQTRRTAPKPVFLSALLVGGDIAVTVGAPARVAAQATSFGGRAIAWATITDRGQSFPSLMGLVEAYDSHLYGTA
jgi:hypothetical protein